MAIEDAFVLGRELRGVGHDREQVLLTLSRLAYGPNIPLLS